MALGTDVQETTNQHENSKIDRNSNNPVQTGCEKTGAILKKGHYYRTLS